MPVYVYEVIQADGTPGPQFECVQGIKDPPLKKHPETGEPVQRVIQPPFIGGTWSEGAMHKSSRDNKKLDKLGFTRRRTRSAALAAAVAAQGADSATGNSSSTESASESRRSVTSLYLGVVCGDAIPIRTVCS